MRPPRDDIAAIAAEFEDKTQSQVENYSCVFWVRSPGLQLQSGEPLLQLLADSWLTAVNPVENPMLQL